MQSYKKKWKVLARFGKKLYLCIAFEKKSWITENVLLHCMMEKLSVQVVIESVILKNGMHGEKLFIIV